MKLDVSGVLKYTQPIIGTDSYLRSRCEKKIGEASLIPLHYASIPHPPPKTETHFRNGNYSVLDTWADARTQLCRQTSEQGKVLCVRSRCVSCLNRCFLHIRGAFFRFSFALLSLCKKNVTLRAVWSRYYYQNRWSRMKSARTSFPTQHRTALFLHSPTCCRIQYWNIDAHSTRKPVVSLSFTKACEE